MVKILVLFLYILLKYIALGILMLSEYLKKNISRLLYIPKNVNKILN